jgi:hypothetical protein
MKNENVRGSLPNVLLILRGIVVAEIGDGRCSQGLPNGIYAVIVLKQYMSNKNCLSLFYFFFFQITRPFLCYLHLPS